jgi:hypothetical protein
MSDPKFPSSMLIHYEKSRIQLLRYLFERYSGLGLTEITDRPRGIASLEKRIASVFKTESVCGIMMEYCKRGLLWYRTSESKMKRIDFQGTNQQIPSWSWMAHQGKITYMEIPFEEVDWNAEIEVIRHVDEDNQFVEWGLGGTIREFSLDSKESQGEARLVFDNEAQAPEKLRCLVVGRLPVQVEGRVGDDYEYAVLVLAELEGYILPVYERVGIAHLKSSEISLKQEGFRGVIL